MFTETRQVTSLIDSIKRGDLSTIKALINPSNVNRKLDVSGNNALHYAIMFHRYEIITFLLENGADTKIKNTIGDDCTVLACRYLNPNFFELEGALRIQEIAQLRRQYTTQNSEIMKLKDTLDHWKKSYQKLLTQHDSVRKECDSLKEENTKLKRKVSYLNDSYDELLLSIKKKKT